MVRYIKGDITKSDCNIICHQVNCQGVMNSGVAKAIREKWPIVFQSYKAWCDRASNDTKVLMGKFQAIKVDGTTSKYVINLFTQQFYGYDGIRFTDYEAFYCALSDIRDDLKEYPRLTIAFPYKIGCVRGGANWNIIKTMIEEVFAGRDVTFYYLNDDNLTWKEKLIVEEYNRKVPIDNE